MNAVTPTEAETMNAAMRFALALKRHGVKEFFAQSLPSALVLACEEIGIRQISYRTENAGGCMADGYARISGRIGIVCAQNGPAASLLVPPLYECMKASIPVIALVQDVMRGHVDRNAFQELDHVVMFQGCTKWAKVVTDAARVEDYLDTAIITATTGRPGPVALMLPMDMLTEVPKPAPHARTESYGNYPLDRSTADPARISEAADILANAKEPLIIAGGGVMGSRAYDELAAIQQECSLPVAYTMMGKGSVSDRHPLTVGLVGNAMGKRSLGAIIKPILDRADVIFLIGNRTNQNGTDTWTIFPPSAKVIHLDVDGREIGRTYEATRLVGDAKLTLTALKDELLKRDLTNAKTRRAPLEKELAKAREAWTEENNDVFTGSNGPIRPERIMRELDKLLTPESIVVADASYSSVWITSYLTTQVPGQRFLAPRGFAGLGWGLPMAMGAKMAAPDRPVICLAGDGGFAHCWQELDTCRRMNIPVTLILINNGILGFQKHAETVRYGKWTSAVHFAETDHVAIAQAQGVKGVLVDNPNDLYDALKDAISSNEPRFLEVMCSQAYPPLKMMDGLIADV